MSRDSGTSKQKKRGPIEKRTQGPNLATNTASIDPSFSSASNNESKTIVMEPNNLKVAPVLDSKAKGKRKSISKEVIKAGTGVNHISEDLTGMSPNGSIAGAYETESDEDMVKQLEAKRFEKIVKHRQIHPPIVPFYDSDTSDEDENTLGNIPLSWYDEYDHVGYDRNGQKIPKPAAKDEIDAFLENKNYVYDSNLNQVRLTKEELELLDRIQKHQFPSGFNPYENQLEYFTSTPEVMPLSGAHEPKRRFIPSKSEGRMIMKIAAKIRQARLKPPVVKTITPSVYDIWNDEPQGKPRNRIQAPKVALPEHLESYNPPSEYLLTEQEEKEWQEMDPEDRTHQFLPRNHDSLRNVGSYPRFIQERFERCLDLYLCPRTIKQKLDIDPESLIPKLPSPKELKPFPTKLSITYKGHSEKIRTICVDPSGQWLASGSDDASVKIWEVSSGRIIKTIKFESSIMSVAWNTNSTISILAVTSGTCVYLVNPGCYTKEVEENTFQVIHDVLTSIGDSSNNNILWSKCNDEDCYIKLEFNKSVQHFVWHRKGDYFATVCPDGQSNAVFIHQLSKATSQSPFKKNLGIVQKVLFHPGRPFLFLCTQTSVRVYNLTKQQLVKKLIPGARMISSMDIHPGGDNLIVGTFDRRIYWFDMDLSTKPYKTLRYHTEAVRQVQYHPRYPLFSSCSDDGTLLVFYGMVYNDLTQNPLMVPVKKIDAHEKTGALGVLDCHWHPKQPWIFSSGADHTVRLFV